MKWNTCYISELIELMWRLAFIKISDNTEEKAHFSNAMHTLPFCLVSACCRGEYLTADGH